MHKAAWTNSLVYVCWRTGDGFDGVNSSDGSGALVNWFRLVLGMWYVLRYSKRFRDIDTWHCCPQWFWTSTGNINHTSFHFLRYRIALTFQFTWVQHKSYAPKSLIELILLIRLHSSSCFCEYDCRTACGSALFSRRYLAKARKTIHFLTSRCRSKRSTDTLSLDT